MSYRSLSLIPPHICKALDAYANEGLPLSSGSSPSFLELIVSNNFVDAACKADEKMAGILVPLALYLHNKMPSLCWGSKPIYFLWLRRHELLKEGASSDELLDNQDHLTNAKMQANRMCRQ